MSETPAPNRRTPRCPICGRPRQIAFRPFCSKRCRDVDLGRWFNQAYAIPGAAADPERADEDEEEDS